MATFKLKRKEFASAALAAELSGNELVPKAIKKVPKGMGKFGKGALIGGGILGAGLLAKGLLGGNKEEN